MPDRLYSPLEKLAPPVIATLAVVALSIFGAPSLVVIPLGLACLVWVLRAVAKHFPSPAESKESDV